MMVALHCILQYCHVYMYVAIFCPFDPVTVCACISFFSLCVCEHVSVCVCVLYTVCGSVHCVLCVSLLIHLQTEVRPVVFIL